MKRGEERATEAGRPDPADDIVDELLSLTVCPTWLVGLGTSWIVEQFPEFRKFATDAFGAIEKAHEATLADGRHSLDQVYQALRQNREIFERELQRDDLTWEQRKHLLELIQETARLASQKDTEHKRHGGDLLKKTMLSVGSVAALAVVFVGGRILVQNREEPDDSGKS